MRTIAFLLLFSFACSAQTVMSVGNVSFWGQTNKPASGGSGTWYESTSSTTNNALGNGVPFGDYQTNIVVTSGGTATKVRVAIYTGYAGATVNCKMSLVGPLPALTPIATAVVSISTAANGTYLEGSITPSAISAGTYGVAFLCESSVNNVFAAVNGGTVAKYTSGETYAGFPQASPTMAGAESGTIDCGIFVQ